MQGTRCLLCGARLTPGEFMNACTGLVEAELGALEAICPHCQGRFEVLPEDGRINLGYCVRAGFQVAQSLVFEGLVVEWSETSRLLKVSAAQQNWLFHE